MRARNIKPGFFKNEELGELPPLARILFAGLWCYADKEGNFEWRPKRIKAEILPYDECDITSLLMSLRSAKFILDYNDNGNTYGFIPGFRSHQNPHPHEAGSKIPNPTKEIIEQFQCHDMSVTLQEMPATSRADSLIPDSLIPEKKNTPLPPKGDYSLDFLQFWKAYPNPKGKGYAWKAWQKANTRPPVEEILKAIQEQVDWRVSANGAFRPEWKHPATWITGRCWDDIITPDLNSKGLDAGDLCNLEAERLKREGKW